jgi:hypothetical protein
MMLGSQLLSLRSNQAPLITASVGTTAASEQIAAAHRRCRDIDRSPTTLRCVGSGIDHRNFHSGEDVLAFVSNCDF